MPGMARTSRNILHELFPDADVVAFHYRGYSPSTGSPSAEALIADAPLVYDAAVARVKPNALSRSVSASAAALPRNSRPSATLDGLILVTPVQFPEGRRPIDVPVAADRRRSSSMSSMRRDALEKAKVPVAIVAAERDEIVPAERTEALARADPEPRFRSDDRRRGPQ